MKRKKRSFSLFSNLTVRKKFALNSIILVAAVITVGIAMAHTIITEQKSKYSQMEKTALTASEHIMNMSVESAVSIATNIYANESVYDFLNTEYAEAVFVSLLVPPGELSSFIEALKDATAGKAEYTVKDPVSYAMCDGRCEILS